MDDLMFGVVVLSAKHSVTLPVLSSSRMNDHIPGAVFHGRSGGVSPTVIVRSVPGRGVSHYVYGGRGFQADDRLDCLARGLSDHMSEEGKVSLRSAFTKSAESVARLGEAVVLEQILPFGLLGLHSNEGGLRLYGLYSEVCDLLVWTNTPDLDHLLFDANRKEWSIYRFKERPSFSTVVSTRRVCQRWFRWASSLRSSDIKFQALEASLFNPHEK